MQLQICIPLLVADQNKLGAAFGVWRAFNSSGSTIVDILFGILQYGNLSATCSTKEPTMLIRHIRYRESSVRQSSKIRNCDQSSRFRVGVSYILVDYRLLGKGMTLTKNQREKKEMEIDDPAPHPLTRRAVLKGVTYGGLALLFAIVITA